MPRSNQHNMPQDWETVVLRGKGANVDAKKRREGATETRTKYDGTRSAHMRKLEEENDVVKPQRINPKIVGAIKNGRSKLGITQKQLASRIQTNVQVVQQYESGKIKADVNILRKMEKQLNVKLTGKEFGGINQ